MICKICGKEINPKKRYCVDLNSMGKPMGYMHYACEMKQFKEDKEDVETLLETE